MAWAPNRETIWKELPARTGRAWASFARFRDPPRNNAATPCSKGRFKLWNRQDPTTPLDKGSQQVGKQLPSPAVLSGEQQIPGCAVPSTDGQSSTSWFVLRGSQGLLCLCCAWHWLCWHQLGDKPDCSCHICFENLPLVWDRPRHWLLEIAELCTSVGKEPKEKEISSWGSGGWFYFTPSPTERHHQDWPTIPEQVEQEVCKPLWIKQQHEVCAWGCRSNTGRGNSSPNLLLIYSGLQTFLLWEHLVLLEEQHHAWNHPLL